MNDDPRVQRAEWMYSSYSECSGTYFWRGKTHMGKKVFHIKKDTKLNNQDKKFKKEQNNQN